MRRVMTVPNLPTVPTHVGGVVAREARIDASMFFQTLANVLSCAVRAIELLYSHLPRIELSPVRKHTVFFIETSS